MIAIVGGGSWGTALGVHLARAGTTVRLWAREPEVVQGLRDARRNPWYLADVEVPPGIEATNDLGEAARGASLVVMVVPSEFFAPTLAALGPVGDDVPILSATKGFDPERHLRMSEVIAARFPQIGRASCRERV